MKQSVTIDKVTQLEKEITIVRDDSGKLGGAHEEYTLSIKNEIVNSNSQVACVKVNLANPLLQVCKKLLRHVTDATLVPARLWRPPEPGVNVLVPALLLRPPEGVPSLPPSLLDRPPEGVPCLPPSLLDRPPQGVAFLSPSLLDHPPSSEAETNRSRRCRLRLKARP